MFEQLPNQWTPALPLTELKDNPQAIELAGERLVLFRDKEDQWHALADRCPHRGAALSLGEVTPEGDLRCGYHGWRYDGAGACVGVPLIELNNAALNKIRVTAFPTRLIGGAVWVFTQTSAEVEVPEPVLPDSLQGNMDRFVTYHQYWKAHWTRAQENFIDFSHPPYLHKETIGAWMYDFAQGGGLAKFKTEDTDFGMIATGTLDKHFSGFALHWYKPNLSILTFGKDPSNWLHIFSIPLNAERSLVMSVRRIADDVNTRSFSEHASGADPKVFDEDRELVESQHGDILSDPSEISIANDNPTLVFRDWYKTMVKSAQR